MPLSSSQPFATRRASSFPHNTPPDTFLAPQNSPRSTSRKRFPARASVMAAASPAMPPPTMMQSNLSSIWMKMRRLVRGLLQLIDEPGKDVVEIAHDAIRRVLKDRGIRVFVDGDDDAAVLHSRGVLDSA